MLSVITSLQIGSIFVVFLIILCCCLLPLKLFRRANGDGTPKFKRILALSNCVAGGVFLGTCFVGLMPMVTKKFNEACTVGSIVIHYPVAETMVVAGFFMILFVEQIVHSVQARKRRKADVNHVELTTLPTMAEDFGYTASDEESSSCESETEVLTTSEMERQPLSKKEKKKRKKAPKKDPVLENGDAHSHSHSHGSHSHEAHAGHSHIDGVLNEESSLRCLILLLALALHSVFEGMALGLQEDLNTYINLLIAVVLHECLCALALGTSMMKHAMKPTTIVKLSVFFSLTIPVGIGIGLAVDAFQGFGGLVASSVLQGIATGTFLYALFFEIIPSAMDGQGDHLLKALCIFIGHLVIALLVVFN